VVMLGNPCLLWLVSYNRHELAPLCTKAELALSKRSHICSDMWKMLTYDRW